MIGRGTTCCRVMNLQGDIVGIVNQLGNRLADYTHDARGKLYSTTGALASTIGVVNPYRYRGYVWDTEIGMFYLQSRYYAPDMGRFINADSMTSTGHGLLGNNMFSYCINNPVNYTDYSGTIPSKIPVEITPDGTSLVGKKKVKFEEGTVTVVVTIEYTGVPSHTQTYQNVEIEVTHDSVVLTFPSGESITLSYDRENIDVDSITFASVGSEHLLLETVLNSDGVGAQLSINCDQLTFSVQLLYTINVIEEAMKTMAQKVLKFAGNVSGAGAPCPVPGSSVGGAGICAGGNLKNVTLLFV